MKRLTTIRDVRGRQLAGMVARDAFERALNRELTTVLEQAFREIANDLLTSAPSLNDRARLMALFARVNGYLEQAYTQVSRSTLTAMAGYSAAEADAARAELLNLVWDMGGDVSAVVDQAGAFLTPIRLQSIASMPIQGLAIGDWWESQAASMSLATRRAIQLGLTQGESVSDIVTRIIPGRASLDPAVWRQARAQASTIVRTSMTAVHADAALESYQQAGSDVSEEYELITARDNRVSRICRALDGLRFRYDDPQRKVPPFHPNCRTTMLPVVNYKALGIDPPDAGSALDFSSLDGWLTRQPAATQNEILGPARARLYRDGRVPLAQLIDEDNRVLTLPQLRAMLGTPGDVVDLAQSDDGS